MVNRTLVTTALEETWPEGKPALFLGEWCRLFTRKDIWSKMDAEVLPYHWDDREKLQADYDYLQSFYERLLPEMAHRLDEIHGVDHGVRYWRILIGPWLNCFVHVLFDRWTTIQQAAVNHDISDVRVLDTTHTSFVPYDMAHYTDTVLGDVGNEQIYSTILKRFTNVRYTTLDAVDAPQAPVPHPALAQAPRNRGLKSRLVDLYAQISAVLSRDTDIVFFMADLPFAHARKLSARFGQVPRIWPVPTTPRVAAVSDRRQWQLNGDAASDFEVAARTLIPQYIPTAYLEGYHNLLEMAQSVPWPKKPKLIYTTTGQYTVDAFKAWAAEKTEQGSKLVIGQHGGQYGIGRWVIHEDHEIAIADRFLSWGWTKPDQPNVKPVGLLKTARPSAVNHSAQPNALLVMASLPRYSYWLRSITIARQWLDYFDDQCTFAESLPNHLRNALVVRLHHKDYDWDQAGRWAERLPDVRLDPCKMDMGTLISQSRLFISTYNATTYLESFAMNVPTVIHWNPKQWELRDSVVSYFNGLQEVGIFHQTPQSAARHVAAVWDDVGTWWNGKNVRREVERFSERFGRCSGPLLGRIEQSFHDALKSAEDRHVTS